MPITKTDAKHCATLPCRAPLVLLPAYVQPRRGEDLLALTDIQTHTRHVTPPLPSASRLPSATGELDGLYGASSNAISTVS